MPNVDILICQFNNADYTVACLESIKKHTKDYRVIFIENASRPEEKKKALKALKDIPHILVENKENLGFVKGVNQGIATSTAPYIVIQNNDTEVEEGWLTKMLEVFEAEPRAGMVGPTADKAASWQNRDRLENEWPKPWPNYKKIDSMLAFFCTVIKREVIEKVGYLSEEYGLGFGDDDDYAERVFRAGYDVFIRLDVTILHHHRTTFKSEIPGWEAEKEKNVQLFKEKWRR